MKTPHRKLNNLYEARPFRLTAKEIGRSDKGVVIIARRQDNGGYLALAVRVEGLQGKPMGKPYARLVETKMDLPVAVRDVARSLDILCNVPMATASRLRNRP